MAATTAAPPDMSSFIRSMPSAGLIEMPPVSNVIPLPTRPSTGDAGAPGGSWRRTMTRGGSALPRATPSSRPMPSCAISSSSRICTPRPAARPISAARSAKTDGVSTFDGSLQRSREMLQLSPRTQPRSTARSRLAESPPVTTTTASSIGPAARSPLLYRSPLKLASMRPSAIACAAAAASRSPRCRNPMRLMCRCRALSPAAEARRRSRSVSKSADLPAPRRATRPARHPFKTGVRNSSNALPCNSRLAMARPTAPPVASSRPDTRASTSSPSKTGSTSKSVSTSAARVAVEATARPDTVRVML